MHYPNVTYDSLLDYSRFPSNCDLVQLACPVIADNAPIRTVIQDDCRIIVHQSESSDCLAIGFAHDTKCPPCFHNTTDVPSLSIQMLGIFIANCKRYDWRAVHGVMVGLCITECIFREYTEDSPETIIGFLFIGNDNGIIMPLGLEFASKKHLYFSTGLGL